MKGARLLLFTVLAIGPCGVAQAHTSERAFILLLPTGLYVVGGAAVVALSFAVIALIPTARLLSLERARWRLGNIPRWDPVGPSLGAFVVACGLVIAGYVGSRDPLANPLPLVVWTLWWVGLTFLHALFGNLWEILNPWRDIYRFLTMFPGLRAWRQRPPLSYPRRVGYWPTVALFFAFAWFELVHPAPQDPDVLANLVTVYLSATFVGMLIFGEQAWLQHGEPFSVFFRMVAWLSPPDTEQAPSAGVGQGRPTLSATLPSVRLLKVGTLPVSGAAFVLLALASVSFDGLSRTFWWLDLVGVNPLDHPGRTALIGVNTVGLLGAFFALAAVYTFAVLIGHAVARSGRGAGESLGRFVVSIIPIAFGYHFAHYLPTFLVDVQYAVRALSDPFAVGWNLLGTRHLHVTASLLTDHRSVEVIWHLQVLGIVAAHVVAITIAHYIALRDAATLRAAVLSQVPLTLLMIGYTLFGLWLLATPVAG